MINIDNIQQHLANDYNYKRIERPISDIQYIVVHYTANVNDTPQDNCTYFAREKIESSAHYFVRDTTVLQSVPLNHAAFACGDKSNPNRASMYGTITNYNSVSIEMCGSEKSVEASETTIDYTAQLVASLMLKFGLNYDRVFRHYDVSGKQCPYYFVQDTEKWLLFKSLVHKYFIKFKEDAEMQINQDEYNKFKTMMKLYEEERKNSTCNWGQADADLCREQAIINDDSRPNDYITRREVQAVIARILRKFFGK